ncbi:uncharacterized protein EDB93DRAFT_1179542, partial [Suillus bovinus]|uniref:uncharacterized protein n=1 Tax=Suillus bovinus TaxID=48563 RepID=UPI001B863F0D
MLVVLTLSWVGKRMGALDGVYGASTKVPVRYFARELTVMRQQTKVVSEQNSKLSRDLEWRLACDNGHRKSDLDPFQSCVGETF